MQTIVVNEAELLSLGEQLETLLRQWLPLRAKHEECLRARYQGLWHVPGASELAQRYEAASIAIEAVGEKINGLPARTLAGLRVKALLALYWQFFHWSEDVLGDTGSTALRGLIEAHEGIPDLLRLWRGAKGRLPRTSG